MEKEEGTRYGVNKIEAEGLAHHTAIMGADDYEGRLPGSPAEQKTLEYLVSELRKVCSLIKIMSYALLRVVLCCVLRTIFIWGGGGARNQSD